MEKKEILVKIAKMRDQGKSAKQIAEHFNELGFTSKSGLKWNGKNVSALFYNNQNLVSKYVKEAREAINSQGAATETQTDGDIVMILNSMKYSDRQKVAAVKALLS